MFIEKCKSSVPEEISDILSIEELGSYPYTNSKEVEFIAPFFGKFIVDFIKGKVDTNTQYAFAYITYHEWFTFLFYGPSQYAH